MQCWLQLWQECSSQEQLTSFQQSQLSSAEWCWAGEAGLLQHMTDWAQALPW
jgi:hypothetical protein